MSKLAILSFAVFSSLFAVCRAAEPAAVWVSGEFEDRATKHGGFNLLLNGNEVNDAGNVAIGSDTALGVTIAISSANTSKASLLVKYKLPAAGAPVANAAIAGVRASDGNPIGAYAKTALSTNLEGFWLSGGTIKTGYAFTNSVPAIASGEGYMLFAFQSDQPSGATPTTGTALYLGSSPSSLSGGNRGGLQWTGRTINVLSIGGPTDEGNAKPWAGLEIEAVALFTDEWYAGNEIASLADYVFPAKGGPDVGGEEVEYPILPYVTRLDGTVFHDNDANRAVITNWQTQILRPAARPKPTWKDDADFATVDLLYVYDAPSKAWVEEREEEWNGASKLEVFSAKATAKMNEIICTTDMDTNFCFRMVGVYEVDADGGSVREVLSKSGARTGGYELLGEMRDRLGADLIVCTSTSSGKEGYGGLSPINDYNYIMAGTENKNSCHASVLISYSQTLAWVHEIGHLSSLNHWAPANFVPADTWRGLGVNHKVSEANGKTFSTAMTYGYGDFCGGFSSVNHIIHGSQLSLSNYLDSTGVMIDTLPQIAKWRGTKVAETHNFKCTPGNGSFLSGDTEFRLAYPNPAAEIYYKAWGVTDGFVKYDGSFTIPESAGYAYIEAYAVTNGVSTATNFVNYSTFYSSCDDAIGSPRLPWSLSGDSVNGHWEQDGNTLKMVEEKFESSKNTEAILATSVRGPATLAFKHSEKLNGNTYDWLPNSSFTVWVDDTPAYSLINAVDTSGEWVETEIVVPDGIHSVEFVYTRRSEFVGSGEMVKIKDVSLDSQLSENPTSLVLTGGVLPEIDKWTSADWRDQENLRYAGDWTDFAIPVSIVAQTNLVLSVDAAIAPESVSVAGKGLVTLRGNELDFASPVAVAGNLALDIVHTNGNYTVAGGARLGGTGAVKSGSVSVASGGELFGELAIDNLVLSGGAVAGSESRATANKVLKSLAYSGEGAVSISNGTFTVGGACDTTAFCDCEEFLVAPGAALALESDLTAKNVTFSNCDAETACVMISTNAALAASGTIDFRTSAGAKIVLDDGGGRAPGPGTYKIMEAEKITWLMENMMPYTVADLLNVTAQYGVQYSIDRSDGDILYATVASVGTVDILQDGSAQAISADTADLDGAYLNIAVSGADNLAVGETVEIFTANSIANTVPNIDFTDSRTAADSTICNVGESSVSLVRTDYNFSTADGAVAFQMPLDWVEEFIEGVPGDAMELMRAPNENGIAPWQAYLLGYAAADAADAKLEATIEPVEGGFTVAFVTGGRVAPNVGNVTIACAILGAKELGGEYRILAEGASADMEIETSAFEERFFKVRVDFNGYVSLEEEVL